MDLDSLDILCVQISVAKVQNLLYLKNKKSNFLIKELKNSHVFRFRFLSFL